jgi:hypothetical protein
MTASPETFGAGHRTAFNPLIAFDKAESRKWAITPSKTAFLAVPKVGKSGSVAWGPESVPTGPIGRLKNRKNAPKTVRNL